MDADVNTLWALVAGLLLLLANVGAIVMLEGLTRRRRVLTVAARHIGGASGAVIGAIAISQTSIDGLEIAFPVDGSLDPNAQLWVGACSAVLLTTLSMAGMAERATVLGHVVGGVMFGALLSPLAASARQVEGFLSTIEFGSSAYVDTAAGSMFVVAGWAALVGTMIIGPRLGRAGRDGGVRQIPGKSMPDAVFGALVLYSTLFGVLARPGTPWNSDLTLGALALLLGGAVGAVVAASIGRLLAGHVRARHTILGLLAGVISTTGDPLEATVAEAAVFGAVGAGIAILVTHFLDSVDVDDPVGIFAMCGAAGMWGSLAIGVTNSDQFLAQLVGTLLISAVVVIVTGLVFGVLRLLQLFRVRPDIEIAGLDA